MTTCVEYVLPDGRSIYPSVEFRLEGTKTWFRFLAIRSDGHIEATCLRTGNRHVLRADMVCGLRLPGGGRVTREKAAAL